MRGRLLYIMAKVPGQVHAGRHPARPARYAPNRGHPRHRRNGILNVPAKDKGAGKEQSITITASSGLSQEEIEQMASDADRFAEEDERKRQEIQTRDNAENAAYAAVQMPWDNADNIPEDLKGEVEGKVATVRSALQNDDIAHVQTTLNDLQKSLQKASQAVYSQVGDMPPPPPDAKSPDDSGPSDDDPGVSKFGGV